MNVGAARWEGGFAGGGRSPGLRTVSPAQKWGPEHLLVFLSLTPKAPTTARKAGPQRRAKAYGNPERSISEGKGHDASWTRPPLCFPALFYFLKLFSRYNSLIARFVFLTTAVGTARFYRSSRLRVRHGAQGQDVHDHILFVAFSTQQASEKNSESIENHAASQNALPVSVGHNLRVTRVPKRPAEGRASAITGSDFALKRALGSFPPIADSQTV